MLADVMKNEFLTLEQNGMCSLTILPPNKHLSTTNESIKSSDGQMVLSIATNLIIAECFDYNEIL